MGKNTVSVSIKLPEDLHEWLIQEVERDDRTKSAIMVRALKEYISNREGGSSPYTQRIPHE